MKKLFICILFICALWNRSTAQTYYYKLASKVNTETGVKSTYSADIYITFTNNKTYLYESDKNGNEIASYGNMQRLLSYSGPNMFLQNVVCSHVFQFQKNQNGMNLYSCYYYIQSPPSLFGSTVLSDGYHYVGLSEDFKRINIFKGKEVIVGERATPPGQASQPSEMW